MSSCWIVTGIMLNLLLNLILALVSPIVGSKHLRLEPPRDMYAFFTGDSFFITCIPDASSGAMRLAWQTPSGRDITQTRGRVHVEPSTNNILGLDLVVEEVQHKDQGTFVCSAVVDGRDTRVAFNLKVYQSLTFWDTPEVQVGEEGNNFMVACNVRADPLPVVSWYVNDSIILDDSRRQVMDDGLLIKELRTSDAGNYTCRAYVVTPHKSQIQDHNIAVHVHYKPYWSHNQVNTHYAVIGSTGNLSCYARAEPHPIFEWFKGRTLLGNSKVHKIINGKYKSILQVKVKSHSHLGSYLCLVSNSVGEIQKEIFLLEGVSPNIPNFTVSSDDPGILSLKINQSPLDSGNLSGYKIQWKLLSDSWRISREYLTGTGTDFLIQDLHFDTEYAVRVSAVNEIGTSNFSEALVQRTKGLVAETVMAGSSIVSFTYSSTSSLNCGSLSLLISVIACLLQHLCTTS